MTDRDPIEMLSAHYANSVPPAGETLLHSVYAKKNSNGQRVHGLIGGFATGAIVAIGLLSWATRVPKHSGDEISSAIARYQMINSGLAERTTSTDEVVR
jgi:hypothetical protein